MKIYLVGGAVRDYLMDKEKLPTTEYHWQKIEKDWVIVGATSEDVKKMLAQGYRPVGKSFPVFLHPQTQEEYALARTEKKISKGYKGFEFQADQFVTLEEDLLRRDLTINAMAMPVDDEGKIQKKIIDPFGGQQDLKNRQLKHVSPAFVEDPVRILRIARLAAKFGDFTVDPETNQLMKQMVKNGEVDALVPERVWQEFVRALKESNPLRFFEVLEKCDALQIIFPEFKNFRELQEVLTNSVKADSSEVIRLAVLSHLLNKEQIKKFSRKMSIPNEFRDLMLLVSQYHKNYLPIFQLSADEILSLFEQTDALRRPNRFKNFLIACEAIYQTKNQAQYLARSLEAVLAVDTKELQQQQLEGLQFAAELRKLRMNAIKGR